MGYFVDPPLPPPPKKDTLLWSICVHLCDMYTLTYLIFNHLEALSI